VKWRKKEKKGRHEKQEKVKRLKYQKIKEFVGTKTDNTDKKGIF